jgi:hypothetical protein
VTLSCLPGLQRATYLHSFSLSVWRAFYHPDALFTGLSVSLPAGLSERTPRITSPVAGAGLVSDIIDFGQVGNGDGMMVAYGVSDRLDAMKHAFNGLPDLLTHVLQAEVSRVPVSLRRSATASWTVIYMPQVGSKVCRWTDGWMVAQLGAGVMIGRWKPRFDGSPGMQINAMEGRVDGHKQINGQMDRRLDGWADGWMVE